MHDQACLPMVDSKSSPHINKEEPNVSWLTPGGVTTYISRKIFTLHEINF